MKRFNPLHYFLIKSDSLISHGLSFSSKVCALGDSNEISCFPAETSTSVACQCFSAVRKELFAKNSPCTGNRKVWKMK